MPVALSGALMGAMIGIEAPALIGVAVPLM